MNYFTTSHEMVADPIVVTKMASVVKKEKKHKFRGGLSEFMNAIAKIESRGNTKAVNQFGMVGKYQFSPKTLRLLGYEATDEFLNNEAVQDSAMVLFTKNNYFLLRKVIVEFNGTVKDGVTITKSGLLAGAHLVGTGGVLSWLYPEKYFYRTVDGNGVSIAYYVQKFGGYNIAFRGD